MERLLDLRINLNIHSNAKDVIDYLLAIDEEEQVTLYEENNGREAKGSPGRAKVKR